MFHRTFIQYIRIRYQVQNHQNRTNRQTVSHDYGGGGAVTCGGYRRIEEGLVWMCDFKGIARGSAGSSGLLWDSCNYSQLIIMSLFTDTPHPYSDN